MLSSKKVVRDIIVIILIVIVGVFVYKSLGTPAVDPHTNEADPHAGMQENMGGNINFELDNHEDALSIDGNVFSMADVDNKAQHFVSMMGGNLGLARSEAVKTLHVEAAMNKGAKELEIEISDEDVAKKIAEIVEEQGGEENYKKFLSGFNISEEAMDRRIRKDLLQGTIFDAIVEKNNLQDESEEAQNEAFEKWLGDVSQGIQIKIISDSLKASLTPPAAGSQSDPAGMSNMGGSEPVDDHEGHGPDCEAETDSEKETP